ncbi:MAG: CBS domain-containing protein [Proteobacteria bacterium]|nr:CBS domain-containing protein [Pseudomonadota bacterium]
MGNSANLSIGIEPGATLARAYLLMEKFRKNQLPVLSDDKIVGVVTQRDIESLINAYSSRSGISQAALKVGNYMQGPVHPVEVGCELSTIVRLMLDERVGVIAVMQDEAMIGVLTRDDLLELLSEILIQNKITLMESLKILESKALKIDLNLKNQ